MLIEEGFLLDLLPGSGAAGLGERIITQPLLDFSDRVVVTTMIPSEEECGGGAESWILQLDPFSGGQMNGMFDFNGDGDFENDPAAGAAKAIGNGILVHNNDGNASQYLGSPDDPPLLLKGDIEVVGRRSWFQY